MSDGKALFDRRERLNKIVLERAPLTVKRFFALDREAYEEGAIPKKYKELIGLVASLVLRCRDCITYHLVRAKEEGASTEEVGEALAIALIVGGSITIPHLREAFKLLADLEGTHGV
jgi:ribonuclease HI